MIAASWYFTPRATTKYAMMLFDCDSGMLIKEFESPADIYFHCFSADGKWLIAGLLTPKPALLVWDLPNLQLASSIDMDVYCSDAGIFSNGQIIASADKLLAFYDARTGKMLRSLPRQMSLTTTVRIAPDERTFLTAAMDGTVTRWDFATGKILSSESLPANLSVRRLNVSFGPANEVRFLISDPQGRNQIAYLNW